MLGRGKFADELMAPDFSKKGVRRFGYQGLTMFGDEQQAMLLVNSSTIAMGETPTLRALVDQRASLTGTARAAERADQGNPARRRSSGARMREGRWTCRSPEICENVNKVLGLVGDGHVLFRLEPAV